MKRIISVVICMALMLTCLVTVISGTENPKVVDLEDLLTQNEEVMLSEKLDSLSEEHSADFVVLTTPSLDGKDPASYADDYYDENGYAVDGVLLLISVTEGYWHISTAGNASTHLSNRQIDDIADSFLTYVREGEYYTGFEAFAEKTSYFLSQNIEVSDTYYEDEYSGYYDYEYVKPPFNVSGTLIIALIVGFFVGWLIASSMKSKLKSVEMQTEARSYVKQGSFELTNQKDLFLFANIMKTPIVRNNPGSGGSGHSGGGSSIHVSSGGVSHGGHGGRL